MTAPPVLQAGIVGAGWIGRRHAEAIAGRDDIAVAAVCDLDPDFRLSGVSGGAPVTAACQSPPFERSVDRFVAAAKAGDPGLVLCSPADAARTLAVAAEEALRTGRKVPVPG